MNEDIGQMESRLHSVNIDFPNNGDGKTTLGYLVECVIMLNDRVKELEGGQKESTNGW